MKEKSLQEVLQENKKRIWEIEKAKIKKRQKKELIIFFFIVVAIIVLLAFCISSISGDLEKCMINHSKNYCLVRL